MLERNDIAAIAAQTLKEYITPSSKELARGIRITSGTSGAGPILLFERYVSRNRFSKYSRTVVCFGSRASRLTNAVFLQYSEGNPELLFLDDQDLGPALSAIFNDFAPEAFFGFVSFVARACEYLSPEAAARVKEVHVTGEILTPTLEAFFKERLPNATIRMSYLAVEIGPISGPPCGYLPVNQYHPRSGVSLDIHEPDEHGVGDLLIDTKIVGEHSISRYRIGDLGKIINKSCPCGAQLTFEVMGRAGHDYLKVAGAILRREEFDRVAILFHSEFKDYRAEAGTEIVEGKLKGTITLTIIPSAQGSIRPALAERFAQQLQLTPTRTLADLIRDGIFQPLTIVVSNETSFGNGKGKPLTQRRP